MFLSSLKECFWPEDSRALEISLCSKGASIPGAGLFKRHQPWVQQLHRATLETERSSQAVTLEYSFGSMFVGMYNNMLFDQRPRARVDEFLPEA